MGYHSTQTQTFPLSRNDASLTFIGLFHQEDQIAIRAGFFLSFIFHLNIVVTISYFLGSASVNGLHSDFARIETG